MFKDHNIPNYYWKCPNTGLEVMFRFSTMYGWCISFVNTPSFEEFDDYFNNIKIDFPQIPVKYREQIDRYFNYTEEAP